MRGSTHLFTGLAAASLLVHDYAGLGMAALGALMPDIDHPDSLISREMTPGMPPGRIGRGIASVMLLGAWYQTRLPLLLAAGIAFLVLTFMPHRGVTHSLLGMAAAWLAIKALGWPQVPFLIGYSVHLAEDALTPSGIPLLYPYQKRTRVPLVRTGSVVDWLIGLAGIVIFVMMVSAKGMHGSLDVLKELMRKVPGRL
ncbi:metal-dependent hydrolase [Moorella naiadis]|uniref:metal-dependent hydrolase n=1 Tax=Moorella naiadis (nom. illeg.) TaxID=3093670 RepID=UPI003D9C9B4D